MTAVREARVDPAGRPLEGRRRQAFQALGIVLLWIVLMGATFALAREYSGYALVVLGFLSWPATEAVAGKKGLVWTGSAMGIVGALTVGLGLSVITPEMRVAPMPLKFAVVSGAAAFVMGFFMLRFRLPGLVSPTVTFTIVALFFAIYGADPAKLAEVEGLSARGVLAAMLSTPIAIAIFTIFSLASITGGRWLDLNGDDFGLAAARPLHLIGIGVFGLILARGLAMLPQPLDMITLAAAWIAAVIWALRLNRFAVMVTAHVAMAKSTFLAFGAVLGFTFTGRDWWWALPTLIGGALVVWPFLHERAMRHDFILGPGGKAPTPREWRWWRYWPYS